MTRRRFPGGAGRLGLCFALLAVFGACAPDSPEADPAVVPAETAGHAAGVVDWCAGHGLPESKCTKCNPELLAGFKESGDWCAEHEFPESACPVCNPQTPPGEQAVADWCVDVLGFVEPLLDRYRSIG